MKKIFLRFIALLFLLLLVTGGWYAWKLYGNKWVHTTATVKSSNKALLRKLDTRGQTLQQYAKTNQYDTSICFLIDMSIESGKNRFFVYDLKKDSVIDAGLVTHGRCNESFLKGRKYGNEVGCGCTSLGKYKIGTPYRGRFGLAYKLHGLDQTNNNAFKRFVVLHAHDCVPGEEVNPAPICQSDGCPTVSHGFLTTLATKIDKSPKPVLLWIFE